MRSDPARGALVRLKDVARIELGALQYSSSAYFGKDPTVVLAVFQMPGSNALDLQKQVKTKMEELSKRFPPDVAYAMHYDTTRFVSAAMRDVVVTLVEALLLVIFVVYIFLQSWRTTIIPTIAIPVSLVATMAVMLMLRLLAQHAEPARHGAGDRPRRRRRHRRGRERRAPAGGRAAADPGGAEGDVGGDGADHRHHGGADGGVRAGRLHSRRRRAAL